MVYYDYHTTVRYSDLSEDNRLSATAILGLMQESAARASARCGLGLQDSRKVAWALCAWKLQIHKRTPWSTALTIRTWPRLMSKHVSDRDFLITDESGDLVVSATSRWLLLDTTTGRVATVTDEISSLYELSDERALEDDIPANGRVPDDAPRTFTYKVMNRDIDTLHHMNNLHYLDLAREALPADLVSHHFDNVEIIYKRQIKLGATVHFYYAKTEDGKHLVEIKDEDDNKTHALIWFF